jgi:hypothetical protein
MKKLIVNFLVGACAIPSAFSAEYSVFRVCEDQHVIRTADGAEAGHVEYVVIEPESRQIVSTVITGGVTGARLVAVPFTSMHFQGGREVTLTEINRERLVSAPVIERTQLTVNAPIQPALVERSFTHFNVQGGAAGATSATTRERATTETDATRRTTEQPAPGTPRGSAATQRESAATQRESATQPQSGTQRGSATAPENGNRERKNATTERSQPNAEREQSESTTRKVPADRTETQREGKPGRELPEGEKANHATPKDGDRSGRAAEERTAPKETPARESTEQTKKAPAEKSDKPAREGAKDADTERTPPKRTTEEKPQ